MFLTPKNHQMEAIEAVVNAFQVESRATIVMPCGTGKTLVAPWVAKSLGCRIVVIFVPSLWLLRQTVGQWSSTAEWCEANYFGVCSDQSAFDDLNIEEITETRITTNPAVVRDYFASLNGERHVVCCTYQSAAVLAEAMPEGIAFDLGVFDEAHCTAGETSVGSFSAGFSIPLLDKYVAIKKRLFMTATPRCFEFDNRRVIKGKLCYSMDDLEYYGERVYELTFSEAVARGLIADYRIIISVITRQDVTREILLSNSSDIESVANALSLKAACEKYGVRKSILFFNTIDECESFSTGHIQQIWPEVVHSHISSKMSATQRAAVMNLLDMDQNISISNARCLTMGIDVPAVDMVAFMRRKRGEIDIVQAVGRASRKDSHSPGKVGFIFLPLFLDDAGGEELSEAINLSGYEQIWTVLEAMRACDGRFDSWISLSRAGIADDDPMWKDAKDIVLATSISSNMNVETIKKSIDARIIENLGDSWDDMFGRLVEFKNRHGHSKVPRNYEDKSLASWYRYQIRTWDSRLNARRKKLLIAIGVDKDKNSKDLLKSLSASTPRWTKEEDDFLRSALDLTDIQISELLNRSRMAICTRRLKLGLQKDPSKGFRKGLFTDDEDKIIIDNWKYKTDVEIGEMINRHKNSVYKRRNFLGLNRGVKQCGTNRRFSKDEDSFIISNVDQTDDLIALMLNRARSSVARRRKDLSLTPSPVQRARHKPWTPEEDSIILNNPDKTYNEIALLLKDRTGTAVYSRRYKLTNRSVG